MIISQPAREGKKKDESLTERRLNPMLLFRRRSNENSERDVLRPDVILFGVEPLTKRSQGVALLSAAATG